MTKPKPARSPGAVALAKLGTSKSVAARVGRSASLVDHWRSGRRIPGDADRAKLAELGIAPDSWAARAPKAEEPPPPVVQPKRAAPPPTAERTETRLTSPGAVTDWATEIEQRAQQLLGVCDELILDAQRREVEVTADEILLVMTPAERAQVVARATGALNQLGKLTGQALQVSEARMLKMPAWRTIEARIVNSLQPWPEALHAVGVALQAL